MTRLSVKSFTVYPTVVYVQLSILKNMQILQLILIGRNLKWSVLIGREHFTTRGRHVKIPYYRSNVQILELFLIGREQFHHQGAPRVIPIIAPEALFCGNIVARGRYRSSMSTALIGREQFHHQGAPRVIPIITPEALFCGNIVARGRYGSRAVIGHNSSLAYHVTSLWRSPSCFAAMLFCDETVTRRRCYNVTFLICISRDLSMEAAVVILSPEALRVKCVDGSDGSRAVT